MLGGQAMSWCLCCDYCDWLTGSPNGLAIQDIVHQACYTHRHHTSKQMFV